MLSPTGSLGEAAAGLFRAMRLMDQSDLDVILAERFPDTGIGRAINDRLERAAYKGH
jgi:L-threonylcarbamoyladenylate synthase